ncbi:MAG: AMP-binding protein [Promethearchaeota archaeon]
MELPDYIKNRYWKDYLPEGITLNLDIPKDLSLCEAFNEYTLKNGDKTFILYENIEYTFKEIQELTKKFSNALIDLGVNKKDIIALWLPNCPEFVISYFATLIIGGSVTVISSLYVAREAAFQINDSGARFLIMDEKFLNHYEKFDNKASLEKIILVNLEKESSNEPLAANQVYFKTIIDEVSELDALLEVEINPKEDIAVIQYTGGTTGIPKGASLTHYNIISSCFHLAQPSEYMKENFLKSDIVAISVLPWYHIFGQAIEMVSSILLGTKLIVLPSFDIKKITEIIKRYQPNTFFGVPTMYITLLNSPLSKDLDISCLKYTHVGASPMPIEAEKQWEKRTGFMMCEGYGLTEASPGVCFSPSWSKKKEGSCGQPLPNTLVGTISEEMEFLPIGRAGELVISGPQVMVGYHNRPEENEEVFFEAGGYKWLRTGDFARIDEEGYIFILDRVKDMIKYKGHSVYPREIEEILYEHPSVLECSVIGIEDPIKGEDIKAYIVLREEYKNKIRDQDIIDWSKENLAAYKYPRIVECVESLPKSPVGKILKKNLREIEKNKTKN